MKAKKAIVIGIAIAILGGAIFAGLACNSIRTEWAVHSFAKEAGAKVAAHYTPAAAQPDRLSARLQETMAAHESQDVLIAIYQPDQFRFRFVQQQHPTTGHQELWARLQQINLEGIDPAPYELDRLQDYLRQLDESLKYLDSLTDTALDDVESAALADAMKQNGVDDLSPVGIMEFASQPKQDGAFPKLQDMLAKANAAARNRDEAIVQIEIRDAADFFRLADEMGVPREQFALVWEESREHMADTLAKMLPVSPHYAALVKELARFREIAKQPPQPLFNPKLFLRIGSKGPAVEQLQQRLALEGYWTGPVDGQYDKALSDAVTQYQNDHQVLADGKVEKVTIERLNVPLTDRVKAIKLALHKLRRSATRNGDYFVRVNTAAQELEVYEDGGRKIIRRHRVIIGNLYAKNHTPIFSDQIEFVEYNPPWMVPQRIIKEEMLPEYEKDPEYFAKMGYKANMTMNEDGSLKKIVSVTQPPGAANALGKVKILFPNKHSVYLHDTPTKYLFKRALRTFSHGCMRLENPLDLAAFLLERDGNAAFPNIEKILESHQTQRITLNHPVPIHIEYVTVNTNDQGKAVFYTDAYGIDEEAMAAMSPE